CQHKVRDALIGQRLTQPQLDARHDVMVNGVPATPAPAVICESNVGTFFNCITLGGAPVGLETVGK
ncbi:unnamed protein product, partial [Allacma fusca]